ncbi:hypothetical protein MJG53_013100 [Ovis ammon polii x Ovis aries]|uniref:Uncharacterized protein n=1 Tax=Ovis ammon polii x Ovis aries TaxID=2918886 RepID=A0ACB9UHN4_9CETA|nr:hypothetical protein MJG53_013100 [Ovis ammon polii x Ovis aries]
MAVVVNVLDSLLVPEQAFSSCGQLGLFFVAPEKHSKDEIVFQLALEQFMSNKHYSEKSTLKEKWEASGGDLEKFAEDLHDDCTKLPDLVRVRMQGQEALFSENMPLKEVIFHLTNQLSTGGMNMGTPSWTVQDTSLETGQRFQNLLCTYGPHPESLPGGPGKLRS